VSEAIHGPTEPDVEKQVLDLKRLLVVTRAMSAEKDLDRLLELIMQETTKVMQADRSSLFLYDEDSEELYTKIAQKAETIRIPVGSGIAGAVATSQQTLHIPDVYADERFNREVDRVTGFRTRNILCTPMLSYDGRLIGVLQVLNKQGGDFTDYDVMMLEALASQAAVALDNARLVAEYLEKQRLQQSLALAREIQTSLLPKHSPELPGFELMGWTCPCDETGGDYYDFVELTPDLVAIVVADVTGHGVGPALLMAETRAYLRGALAQETDVSTVLSVLNNQLCYDMTQGRFVTMFLATLDVKTRQLRYSSAGHGHPLLWQPGVPVKELESTGPPLGVVSSIEFPPGDTMLIESGSVLLATTDGVEEAMNETGEMFGRARLKEVLSGLVGMGAQGMLDGLKVVLSDFTAGVAARDDLTMVTLIGSGREEED